VVTLVLPESGEVVYRQTIEVHDGERIDVQQP
jgi:hypothetical protein